MKKDPKVDDPAWAAPSPVEHGGRVELRLVAQSDGTTRYAARWFTADEQMNGEVSVSAADNRVAIDCPATLPDWLSSFTTSLVRTTARQAEKEGTWPRRLTRWRKSPEEKGSGTDD